MKTYPSYEILAIDLDLHFFDKMSILKNAGNRCYDGNGSWCVITDDGHFHLLDKNGNLDDVNKITTLYEHFIRKNIKKIIIPNSVTSIRYCAFYKCSSLKSVFFKGKTLKQVRAMSGYPWRIEDISIIKTELK